MNELHISSCITLVEQKFNQGSSSSWVNKDYLLLSEEIFRSTGFSISSDTLKRLFGKKKTEERYQPQQATLDALAKYLGYKDFLDYSKSLSSKNTVIRKSSKMNVLWFLSLFLFLMIFLYSPLIKKYKGTSNQAPDSIFVKIYPQEGNAPIYPKIKNLTNDTLDVLIFNKEQVEKRLQLLAGKDTIIQLAYPALYIAEVRRQDDLVQRSTLLACSEEWERFVSQTGYFWQIPKTYNDSVLSIYQEDIELPDTNNVFWSQFRIVDTFDIDGDNFLFQAKIKNDTEKGGLKFNDCIIYIAGCQSFFRLHFIEKNYDKYIRVRYSDVSVIQDPNYCQYLSYFRQVTVKVVKRRISVYVDNKIIDVNTYNLPVGDIREILFVFKGIGVADDIELSNLKRTIVYKYDKFVTH